MVFWFAPFSAEIKTENSNRKSAAMKFDITRLYKRYLVNPSYSRYAMSIYTLLPIMRRFTINCTSNQLLVREDRLFGAKADILIWRVVFQANTKS